MSVSPHGEAEQWKWSLYLCKEQSGLQHSIRSWQREAERWQNGQEENLRRKEGRMNKERSILQPSALDMTWINWLVLHLLLEKKEVWKLPSKVLEWKRAVRPWRRDTSDTFGWKDPQGWWTERKPAKTSVITLLFWCFHYRKRVNDYTLKATEHHHNKACVTLINNSFVKDPRNRVLIVFL